METIAKAAGVHGVVSKDPFFVNTIGRKGLAFFANRQSASSDGITLSARPQPEGVR